ncbi:protein FAR1-RELATED SEQUENCE 11-like [Rutidosis leptorrhynchoides]|uniref:protein FAR1-RELATED SEQUENCE 11-like n=1 Tax=Rutidosis leptorrhynchoides TaxID=125765 RepID=UPI003A99F5C0
MHKKCFFDLNQTPTETYTSSNIDESEITFDKNVTSMNEIVYEPFVGQCFLSEEEAFVFYQKFAKENGFSVRKGRFDNKNGEKRRRDFFCHREGKPVPKIVDHSKQQRNRGTTKCECKAHMRIKLRKINEICPKEWQVTSFILEHHHDLLSTEEVPFLPSFRSITNEDEKRIIMLREGGLSVKQIMRVMELEKNLKHGQLDFLSKDVRNLFGKVFQKKSHNDARDLLEYCQKSRRENSRFQYAFTVDDENKLENIFWSLAHCFDWYQSFGDVVVFDTTYKVNSYEMPFGIFVGIDNNGRTILFGCALLRNETTKTFEWLMKIFVLHMTKAPKTILTDQDKCIIEAISKEMPSTKHAFCIWHITNKFSSWFNSTLRSDYSSWCSEFYNLYKLDTIDECEQQWPSVITKYNLRENKHIIGLYRVKTFWVPAYLREFFFGGMTTTGRSESINAFVKKFLSSNTLLLQFIKQVDFAIEDAEQTQLQDIMLEKYRGSQLRSQSPLEEQAHRFLSPYAFKKFQVQFGLAIQYSIKPETCTKWSRKGVSNTQEASFENVSLLHTDEHVIDLVQCPPISKTKGRPKDNNRIKGGKELVKQNFVSATLESCGRAYS